MSFVVICTHPHPLRDCQGTTSSYPYPMMDKRNLTLAKFPSWSTAMCTVSEILWLQKVNLVTQKVTWVMAKRSLKLLIDGSWSVNIGQPNDSCACWGSPSSDESVSHVIQCDRPEKVWREIDEDRVTFRVLGRVGHKGTKLKRWSHEDESGWWVGVKKQRCGQMDVHAMWERKMRELKGREDVSDLDIGLSYHWKTLIKAWACWAMVSAPCTCIRSIYVVVYV